MQPRLHTIAFDPGVDFAAAWSVAGEVHASSTCRWDLRKHKDPGRRYLALWEHLKKQFPFGADNVVVEFGGFSPTRMKAAAAMMGYLSQLQTWSAVHGTTPITTTPQCVRKWATGRGVASKEERAANKTCEKDRMRAAALARWPEHRHELSVVDHNRIDALWVLAWGLRDEPPVVPPQGCGGECGCPSRSCPQTMTRGFYISKCDCWCHPVPV